MAEKETKPLDAEIIKNAETIQTALAKLEIPAGATTAELKLDAKPFYEFVAPFGITEESEAARRDAFSKFYAAAGYATGLVGNNAFVANKDLKQVDTTLSVGGRDHVEFGYRRSAMVPNGNEQVERFGVLTGKVVISGTSSKAANIVAVKTALSTAARERFGK